MSSVGKKLLNLQEQIHTTKGWSLMSRLRNFNVSIYTFQRNNEEIVKLLDLYETNTDMALHIFKVDNREEFEIFLREITRLLHNYLAAAKTLIDHTRKLCQDEYKGTEFEAEYNEKINELFVNSPISKFIQDLRNYSLHRNLPITGATLSFNRDSGMSHSINLTKKSLMDWDNWTRKSLDYLSKQDDQIGLPQMIKEYTSLVMEFQEWFQEKQYEYHSDSIAELEDLQEEYRELYEEVRRK